MIVRKSEQGNISVAFGGGSDLRITGAGITRNPRELGLSPCPDYRIIVGNGLNVTVCGEKIFIADGMALTIAPGVFAEYENGEKSIVYADFITSEKLFSATYKTVYYGGAARFEALIGGLRCKSDCFGLYAEVLRIAALCDNNALLRSSCDDVKRYFDKYFYLPLSVAEQAAVLGFSREYFTARFTKEAGCSPYKYLTRVRIKNAERLLRETDNSIREIAYMCGYENVERFDEMFRKNSGLSPLKYRNKFAGMKR